MTRKEQIIEILKSPHYYLNGKLYESDFERIVDDILALPLDVPSDEEIEKKAMNHNRTDNYTTIDYYSTGIIVGSKWVRDEILKRNK
jgi:hypothetical protein